jgi:hypothetical protein
MIKKGDRVYIKPEWQDKGDDEIEFVAMCDEYDGRVKIGCLNVLQNFIPVQLVMVDMLLA